MSDKTLQPGTPSDTPLVFHKWSESLAAPPVDYHMHTTYTDGRSDVGEMIEAAVARGMTEILFSDHVRHDSSYFPRFVEDVRSRRQSGLTIYVGAEAKVLDTAGTLDCSPSTASLCDAIIGSVHSAPPEADGRRPWSNFEAEEALELEFRLAMAIVTQSRAHILGHPLGISVAKFDQCPTDRLYELAVACRRHGKAFELNPRYIARADTWLDVVRRAECPVSFGSDAHEARDVGGSWEQYAANRCGVVR